MATIANRGVNGGFDEDPWKSVEEFLRDLNDLNAEPCDVRFLRRLVASIQRAMSQGQQRPMAFMPPIEDIPPPSPKQRETDDKIDRIELLLESMAGKKRSFTTQEIATLEDVTADTVRDWIRKGQLRAVPDPNRMAGPHPRKVILAEDYERFKRAGH